MRMLPHPNVTIELIDVLRRSIRTRSTCFRDKSDLITVKDIPVICMLTRNQITPEQLHPEGRAGSERLQRGG